MPQYKADLHIHSVLSPCGEVDMSPQFIVRRAVECGLDMIAVTDHNTTLQCALTRRLGAEKGLLVLYGAEVTTAEEAHCLALFGKEAPAAEFQKYLSERLPDVKNRPELFGWQVVVDENERITYEEPRLLISAISAGVEEVCREVHRLGGLFIPAHVDKPVNSLLRQLGFIPPNLEIDALELSPRTSADEFLIEHPGLSHHRLVSFSDAHLPEELSRRHTLFEMEELSFEALKKALR